MRTSSWRSVQSGGNESQTALKSSASATRGTLYGCYRALRIIDLVIATDEYTRLREAVGTVDRSDRGKAIFRGPEAPDFLQGQVSNDVEGLTPGTGCYAALLTPKGKMLADMRILRGPAWLWLDTESAGLPAVAKMIRTFSIGRDTRPENVTDSRAILSLVGPGAEGALDPTLPAEEHSFVEGEHG